MNNYLVFREEGRNKKQIRHTYEHNERMINDYYNKNIDDSLKSTNIYFKTPSGDYLSILEKRIEKGEINTKGLKPDANVFSEILIAVNRDFWCDKSEEYIRGFFKSAYNHLAEKFGENNIISAVVHCDEVSEGKINYHMHVVAVPVVQKERYYTKRSKQYSELATKVGEENIKKNDKRLLKCVENQISHNKFFASRKENNKMIYSYAVWQDELLQSFHQNGYKEILRGSENKKAVHLHPNAYKQIMERIEFQADCLLPQLQIIQKEEKNYQISANEVDAIFYMRRTIAKEKACYDLAVEALNEEQERIFKRQHLLYSISKNNMNMEQLQEKYEELQEINRRLNEKISLMVKQLIQSQNWIQKILICLNEIYEMSRTEINNRMSLKEFRERLKQNIEKTIETIKQENTISR